MKNFKNLKTYESYFSSKKEVVEQPVNEGLGDMIKKGFNYILDKFKTKYTKGAWLYFALWLQEKGLLKKHGVEVYYSKNLNTNITESYGIMNEGRIGLESTPSIDKVANVNAEQLVNTLSRQFIMKTPIFVWGAPGIGKTDIVKQVGKKFGVPVIIFTLSVRDPVDFIGLPSIEYSKKNDLPHKETDEKGVTVYNVPKLFPTDNGPEDKGVILFFDEMNRANQSVLAASLQLILDRKLNDYVLPSKCVVFAAGNRKEEVPTVTEIEPALGNRFKHVNLTTTFENWEQWALSKDSFDETIGENLIDPNILSFVKFSNKWFHYLDPDIESPVWASPRSWTMASKEFIYYKNEMEKEGKALDEDEIKLIISQSVGMDAAIEFVSYLKLIQHIKPQELDLVYSNFDKAPLPPKQKGNYEPSITYAMIMSIAFRKNKEKLTESMVENLFKYAIKLDSMEYATSLLKTIGQVHNYIKTDENFKNVMKKWAMMTKDWSDHYHEILKMDK